ncbi:MAG: hypothetical protein SOI66_09675 [Bifidobacterium sp.]|jgi:hypothetical protein
MIEERRGPRRVIVIVLILVIALFSGVMLYPRVYENMTGYTLFQPSVDTAHTDYGYPTRPCSADASWTGEPVI